MQTKKDSVESTTDYAALPPTASSARSVPLHNWRAHWLTVVEFSRLMGREPVTIHKWVRDGTLAEFGVPVMHFQPGRRHSGRTFILNIY